MAKTMMALVAAVVLGTGSAHAGEVSEYARAAGIKLAHGLGYMAYSPVELVVVPVAFAVEQDRQAGAIGAGRGLMVGMLFGPFNAVARWTFGGAEVFTFPIVGDSSAARPFDLTPQLSGWSMVGTYRPQEQEPVRTAVASQTPRRRPSGD